MTGRQVYLTRDAKDPAFFRVLDVRQISIDKTSPKTSRDGVCKIN